MCKPKLKSYLTIGLTYVFWIFACLCALLILYAISRPKDSCGWGLNAVSTPLRTNIDGDFRVYLDSDNGVVCYVYTSSKNVNCVKLQGAS